MVTITGIKTTMATTTPMSSNPRGMPAGRPRKMRLWSSDEFSNLSRLNPTFRIASTNAPVSLRRPLVSRCRLPGCGGHGW